MKTKNFLLTGALLIMALFSVNGVMAQATSNTAVINLKFKPIQSITVATDQKEIDFKYESVKDYTDGVTVPKLEKHLKVFSTGGFNVNVKASGENFTSANTELTIPVNHITVIPTKSDGNNKGTYAFTSKALSNSDGTIITSTGGGKDLEFDVEYDNTSDADFYTALGYNKNHLDNGYTVFTTTLTYTITTN